MGSGLRTLPAIVREGETTAAERTLFHSKCHKEPVAQSCFIPPVAKGRDVSRSAAYATTRQPYGERATALPFIAIWLDRYADLNAAGKLNPQTE